MFLFVINIHLTQKNTYIEEMYLFLKKGYLVSFWSVLKEAGRFPAL
jgi:hypothetical protein